LPDFVDNVTGCAVGGLTVLAMVASSLDLILLLDVTRVISFFAY
jgi:hypothetical protein